MKYALVFDLGTGSVKASLVSEDAKIMKSHVVTYETKYGDGGIREQRPTDWFEGIREATAILLKDFHEKSSVVAIALSGHSLGVIAVDEKGNLLSETTPIWSDARATEQAEQFFQKVDYRQWYETTGNGFPPHLYSVFKIMWYREKMPELYDQTAVFLGSKDYINACLTGQLCTDQSYASGSGVYDLSRHAYREDYIDAAGLDASKFPVILRSDEVVGTLKPSLAQAFGLSESVVVVAGGVDNACMTLGAGCITNGSAYISLGSSAWIAVCADHPVVDFEKKIYTWEHCVDDMYIPSSGIFSCGTALEWVKNRMFPDLSLPEFDRLAATSPLGANGVTFCPVLSGGSSVDVSDKMKGSFMGLELGSTRADIARGTLEGIAWDLLLAVEALESRLDICEPICAVGGGAKSEIWLNMYANILDKNIRSGAVLRDTAALGAAGLAFRGCGLWTGYEKIVEAQKNGTLFMKDVDTAWQYRKMRSRFELLCQQCADYGLSSETLQKAYDTLEAYPDLLVRIGGHSRYFNEFDNDMKNKFIERFKVEEGAYS